MVRNPNEHPEPTGRPKQPAGPPIAGSKETSLPPDVRSWREHALDENTGKGQSSAMREARDAAQHVADDLKERSAGMIDQQKGRLAEQLHHLGNALHKAGDSLEEQEDGQARDIAHGLAQRIDQAADYIDRQSLGDIADELRDGLRRHPEAAVVGLIVGGVMLARFLKASTDRPTRTRQQRPNYARESNLGAAAYGSGDDITRADESGAGRGESMSTRFDIAESTEYPGGRSASSHGPAGPERPPESTRPAGPSNTPAPAPGSQAPGSASTPGSQRTPGTPGTPGNPGIPRTEPH